MSERVVAPVRVEEDAQFDAGLRPRILDEYIGQDRVRDNLQVSIAAARQRNEALDHVLLYGPPGLGKTTLAYVIGNELGVPVSATAGPAIEKPGDLAGMLTALLGLLWADLRLGVGTLRTLFWLSVYQGWSQTAGLILAAAFGTSRSTPMAGAGFTGEPWEEAIVALLLTTGAVAILVCCGLAVHGLRRPRDNDNRRAGF